MRPTEIMVHLPSMLTHCTDGQNPVSVKAVTLKEVLSQLVRSYPLLKVHLHDENGVLREHVLVFYNRENTRWMEHLEVELKPGDKVRILQAVTGG